MESYIKYAFWGILIVLILAGLFALTIKPEETYVLGEKTIVSPSEEPSPSPSPSPSLYPSPTATPTATPSPTPKPIPLVISSQEINGFIDKFAGDYGVDPNVLRHIAICESGFNPRAVNWIYVGLYQFGPITWRNIRSEIGEDMNINLRYSGEESVQTAAYVLSKGKTGIWPNCAP